VDKVQFLVEHVPFFRTIPPAELEPVSHLFHERRYKKGNTIFFEDEGGDEFYIIVSGTVKIYRMDGNKEFILAIFREGDFFGEMALMQPDKNRSATAEALEATTLYVLHRNAFYQLLETNIKLTLKILEVTMDRLRIANEKIEDLTFLDVRSRILRNILRLARDYGVQTSQGVLVDFKLTHQQLADMVGAVRETVTKVLLELQDEHLIDIDKKRIVIKDLAKLEKKVSFHV
jgi:CRP/FNR family transcriptional regulator, cyclic AMP receptor protein